MWQIIPLLNANDSRFISKCLAENLQMDGLVRRLRSWRGWISETGNFPSYKVHRWFEFSVADTANDVQIMLLENHSTESLRSQVPYISTCSTAWISGLTPLAWTLQIFLPEDSSLPEQPYSIASPGSHCPHAVEPRIYKNSYDRGQFRMFLTIIVDIPRFLDQRMVSCDFRLTLYNI